MKKGSPSDILTQMPVPSEARCPRLHTFLLAIRGSGCCVSGGGCYHGSPQSPAPSWLAGSCHSTCSLSEHVRLDFTH